MFVDYMITIMYTPEGNQTDLKKLGGLSGEELWHGFEKKVDNGHHSGWNGGGAGLPQGNFGVLLSFG